MINNRINNSNYLTVGNSTNQKEIQQENFLNITNHCIFELNETKLNENSKIEIKNYDVIRKDRNRNGSGVAILIRNDLSYSKIPESNKYNIDVVAIKVKLKNNFINFICLNYHPTR